jgi:hypothetical protein
MKLLFLITFLLTSLFASLQDKSAIVYYGENISYPMVGIHDYIIVQPAHIDTYTHGFKVYKKKMYAYVSIGEIDRTIPEYKKIKKEWILAENSAWSSDVLDLKNPEYIDFLFEEMIEPQRKRGFENFFFDTLDSYQLASKTKKERQLNEKALVAFIKEFHKRYPKAKLVVNRGFEIIDQIHDSIDAVLFESYYKGIGGKKLGYKDVSDSDREWLDVYLDKAKKYKLDIISVDYLDLTSLKSRGNTLVKKLQVRGFIPYIANRDLDIYGLSSKNAIKREVFTLIDEKRLDRTLLEAHQYGGTVLEYMGYIQKLHNLRDGFPKLNEMRHYAGAIVWLQDYYENPQKLIKWVRSLQKIGLKVVFVNNFGFNPSSEFLEPLGIKVANKRKVKRKILFQNEMIGFEIEPSLAISTVEIEVKNSEALLVYEYMDKTTSTPAAITPWGGYMVDDTFMTTINGDNIWVVNPFKFFKKALALQELLVPDVTTENGKRLLFTHVDGDGIMNRVEGDFGYYSGDVILNKILKVYKIPHSISVIGAEISPKGIFPKISPELIKITKEIYALDNVEPATHTFTHPFFWDKIVNDNLDEKYRLKPKGYTFSLEKEIKGELDNINKNFSPKHKAKMVFWSGDCAPRENALSLIEKEDILNINGGDTTIMTMSPWLSQIAPLGLERGEHIQVYTGAQNENVFTNDWLGPFWGFKRVVQTFEMTNSPRRFKPIDIYYHLYSGSKQASLKALEFVFDWAMKQDTMPIFTSEYIPKVFDFYTASMANEGDSWLVSGMKNLKTLRVEHSDAGVDMEASKTVLGLKHFEGHTYISLDTHEQHLVKLSSDDRYKKSAYLISANAKVIEYRVDKDSKKFVFSGHVDLELEFNVPKSCHLLAKPDIAKIVIEEETQTLHYKGLKKALVTITCQ